MSAGGGTAWRAKVLGVVRRARRTVVGKLEGARRAVAGVPNGVGWNAIRNVVTVVLAAGAAAFLWQAATSFEDPGILDLQFAGSDVELHEHLLGRTSELGNHLRWDVAFVATAAVGVAFLTGALRSHQGPHRRRLPVWAWAIGVLPFLLDLVENGLLEWARRDHDCWSRSENAGEGCRELAPWIETVAYAKWIAYGVLVLAVVVLVVNRRRPLRAPAADPPVNATLDQWEEVGGTGIALSGGGIRSAAFGLGGLTGLGNERVRDAKYLSAASGGAYMAAAMTLQAHREVVDDPTPQQLPFHHGSEELKRVRARSSYLALHGAGGRIGFFRALSAIAFNILLLWLVVFAVGRPVGWLVSSEALHPELQARTPLLGSTDLADEDVVLTEAPVELVGTASCQLNEVGQRYLVRLEPTEIVTDIAEGVTDRNPRRGVTVPVTFTPGEVRACTGELVVTAQPRAIIDEADLVAHDNRADEGDRRPALVEVATQPGLRIAGAGGLAAVDPCGDQQDPSTSCPEHQLAERIEIATQPVFEQQTGFRGRADITIEGWMWGVTLGSLVLAALWAAVIQRGSTLVLSWVPSFALVVAAVVGTLTIALPWTLQQLPTAADRIFALLPGDAEAAPGQPRGFIAWLAALLAAGQAVRSTLTKGKTGGGKARRSSRLLLKVAAFVLLIGVGAATVVAVVQQGALNGPAGRLSGFHGYWWTGGGVVPDLVRWAVVVGFLALFAFLRPAHHWSFLPLYRDRLAAAFTLGDEPISSPEDRKDLELRTFADCRSRKIPEAHRPWWPELVVCAAVNLNDSDITSPIPAKRWADSFTFSASEIGGPTTGYVSTQDYEASLSPSAKKDLTLASAVAVSGAAFSPAMGKMALGPIGGLLALLNLRLGLWLPHPSWVGANPEPGAWRRRPGWPYLLREVLAVFRRNHSFLFITDGGHWENLGLVELLRRGCTEIYVLSAAGDGQQSFATINEAIALAREQCEVDIDVELSPMRAPVADPDPPPARQLLRGVGTGEPEPEPFAPSAFAVGVFEYPASRGGCRGRILFAEANITKDLPWDVHAWAESNPVFPDDPTSDQSFDHRQFEAYRRLGEHQLGVAVASEAWAAAQQWVCRAITKDELRALLSPATEDRGQRPGWRWPRCWGMRRGRQRRRRRGARPGRLRRWLGWRPGARRRGGGGIADGRSHPS